MNARVLLQMSASEILLHLPNRNQRKAFKDIVESSTGLAGGKQYVYFSERSGGRKERGKRTIKVMWADRFYSLRNHIIHGNSPPASEYNFNHRGWSNQRHVDRALWFFIILVKHQIEKSLRHSFLDDIVWEAREGSLTSAAGIGFLYQPISFGRD